VRLIHLSDPHLTSPEHPLAGRSHWGKRYLGRASWRRRRRLRHRREWLDPLVAAVQAANADQILLTGDLVHIGLPEEIAEASIWLRQLGPPQQVLLVPGNHDVYAADSWPAVREHWGEYLHLESDYPVSLESAELQLLAVSSALPTRPGSACGLIGEAQCRRLETLLRQPRTRPRLLAIHHPPLPGMIGFRKRLRDAPALQQLLAAHPVDLVLHGHGHHDRTQQCGDMRVYGVGSASYQQASYRCFDIEPGSSGWQVRMRLFRNESGNEAFHCVEESSWQIGAVGATIRTG
jgi:3',5'-cyclic AMP phosphodiesterase CpdA